MHSKLWRRVKALRRSMQPGAIYLEWLRQELSDTLSGWHGGPVGDEDYFKLIREEVERVEQARSWRSLRAYLRKGA
jgi:hypothetical protein